MLVAGTTFTFKLKVTNDWDLSSEVSHVVKVLAANTPQAPSIEIIGPKEITMYSSQRMELRADASTKV
jgi:hypothetical protein